MMPHNIQCFLGSYKTTNTISLI